jgi:hypothetical protein
MTQKKVKYTKANIFASDFGGTWRLFEVLW